MNNSDLGLIFLICSIIIPVGVCFMLPQSMITVELIWYIVTATGIGFLFSFVVHTDLLILKRQNQIMNKTVEFTMHDLNLMLSLQAEKFVGEIGLTNDKTLLMEMLKNKARYCLT